MNLGRTSRERLEMCMTGRDSAIIVAEKRLGPMGAGMSQGGPVGSGYQYVRILGQSDLNSTLVPKCESRSIVFDSLQPHGL